MFTDLKKRHSMSAMVLRVGIFAIVTAALVGTLFATPSSVNAHIVSAPSWSNSSLTSDVTTASVLNAPSDVTATGLKRTITVSWGYVAGVASYTVAVRPANGTQPLEWVEHQTAFSPYIISGKLVMSDLEYEVRVAAIHSDGQPVWSDIATVLVPALQPAPSGAIDPKEILSYHIGDIMAVAVTSQRPFENRSVWHWFVCDAYDSGCKLLPVPKHTTYTYRATRIARGKFIKVQVDYDKDGDSYSASAVVATVISTDELGGTPTEVAAVATNRQVTVSWDEVAGATGYRVSIRPKKGTRPLSWIEHLASAPPYTVLDYWVMSGLDYEIRVSAFNDAQHSDWSRTATVAGPLLESAPSEAVEILTAPPYRVGDVMHVSLAGQHPFESRSLWHWFLCDLDGSDCKLLPLEQTDAHMLVIPDIARYKRVEVQQDYRKDGVFYSARVTVGTVEGGGDASVTAEPMPTAGDTSDMECVESSKPAEELFTVDSGIETFLYDLRLDSVSVLWDEASGGAVEAMCDDLLLATPWGRLTVVRPGGSVEHLDVRVPMDLDELLAHPDVSRGRTDSFRVGDILLRRRTSELWELFVTHHYFTGERIRFRLSSATIVRSENGIAVSTAWRTIFDAVPSLPVEYGLGTMMGGRMMTDGPDHLLVITGSHGIGASSQDSESHLGKLLRVEIETGDTEVLASGFRNSQGLARDEHGNLWATDHGPYGGDELNLLEPGANYGWPLVTYGLGGSTSLDELEGEKLGIHDGFALPVFSWIPGIGISSVIVNDGRLFPFWKDDLLIASLAGSGNGLSLFRVRRAGVEIQYVERIKFGWRIRDLAQMPDGRIVLLRDNGRVYFISRDYSYCDATYLFPNQYIYTKDCELRDDDRAGEERDVLDDSADTDR